ncbi:MAG TPA: methyltransferase domain-containing protein [Candidatus Limnocylindria bacterium]|nr:methyltransferase domain-containing protein [Candidatus Limnocylindria bacterium]
MWQRLFFELLYRFGRPRWDTGITPPELVDLVARTPAGRAVDLGCGTGTNAVYLAERGWEVTGIDFSSLAVDRARRRARDAGTSRVRFLRADVTELPDLGTFDLAYDIGCLHAVPARRRTRYAAWLAASLRSGAPYLLYAFTATDRGPGIARADVERLFAESFELERSEEGTGRPSAWYRFARR